MKRILGLITNLALTPIVLALTVAAMIYGEILYSWGRLKGEKE